MVKWSISAINQLRRCNRQYYFAQVAASHGRKNPFRREAYELKSMQNLKMWPGSVVDTFIEKQIIPRIDELTREDFPALAEEAVKLAEQQFRFSENLQYKDPDFSKSKTEAFAILQLHKLNQSYTRQELEEAYQKIRESIRNFPELYLPQTQQYLLEYLKEAGWKCPNVMNWSFEVNGAKVSPQIDLLLFYQNKPVIIDWKVSDSSTSDYSRQLLVCGLTVKNWNKNKAKQNGTKPFKFEDFTLMEVNLWNKTVKYHNFTQEEANKTLDYINLTASDLDLILGGRKYDQINIEEFDLTDKDTTCNICNFKSLCCATLQENYSL